MNVSCEQLTRQDVGQDLDMQRNNNGGTYCAEKLLPGKLMTTVHVKAVFLR